MQYLVHTGHFSFNIRKLLLFDLLLNLEFEWDLNQSEFSNNNRGDVASLAEVYCSLIIRASQFSSTTRNLVPRFRRGVRGGGGLGYGILTRFINPGGSSRSSRAITLMSSFLCFRFS